MFTTLYMLFGEGEKEAAILTFFVDLLIFVALTFLLGRMIVWLDVIILSALFACINIPVRRYDEWREKERMRMIHSKPGWTGGFSQKWMPYADLWTQLVGRGMVKVYIAVLLLGKCSTYLF